jgi:hypothetical protein
MFFFGVSFDQKTWFEKPEILVLDQTKKQLWFWIKEAKLNNTKL